MAHNIYQEMGYVAKDEYYTTTNESEKLIKYLWEYRIVKKDDIIWLPFDNEISNIYKILLKYGYKNIVLSNLEVGLDFYNYEPENWDIIITNPPFSGRTHLMKRLMSFNKPFIILQGTQYFNNQYAVNYLSQFSDDFKFLLPRTRMSFMTYNEDEDIISSSKSGASFYSFWLCYKTKVDKTFTSLKDNGNEKNIERLDLKGNVIVDNHVNLFNIGKDEE
jgi:hypothetical protein